VTVPIERCNNGENEHTKSGDYERAGHRYSNGAGPLGRSIPALEAILLTSGEPLLDGYQRSARHLERGRTAF
jgi:hypothetical protein